MIIGSTKTKDIEKLLKRLEKMVGWFFNLESVTIHGISPPKSARVNSSIYGICRRRERGKAGTRVLEDWLKRLAGSCDTALEISF
jgi:hypothetical protein